MYGAILGDIIGAPYEFDDNFKTKEFELFDEKYSVFTDDTVMTIAIAEALLAVELDASIDDIESACRYSMQKWGKKYKSVGYGDMFSDWILQGPKAKAYNSFGNGSAMRVSCVGWLYDSLERTREVARATANVSHNHVEGLKGAEATAAVIYLSRTGSSKDEIKKYVINEFGYNLNRTLDEIRPAYHMDETCQGTVPECIIGFLEGNDFEDVIRNVVSLGGDTDTTGAIAGSMAEAFYGVPENLINECKHRIDSEMLQILKEFDAVRIERKNR